MASTDATPLPIKGQAFRLTFQMWLTTGLVNSGAAGLDEEVSKDGGTMTDCTNSATEIATSSGSYFIDLTATEMNADTIEFQCKSSTTNATTYKCTIYPSSLGKMQVDVRSLLGTGWLTPAVPGTPDVNAKFIGATAQTGRDIGASVLLSSGTGAGQISLSSGLVSLSGTQTFNVTGNITGNLSGSVGSVTGNVSGNVVGSVGSISGITFPTNFANLAITAGGAVTAGTVSDKTGYFLSGTQTFNNTGTWTGNLTGSVGSVTSPVTVGTNNDKTGYSLSGTQAFNNTGTWTGNLTGSVGSVAGNVTGSVGSVTGLTTATLETVTGKLNTMINATPQFTALALALAPGGGGGGGSSQDAADGMLLTPGGSPVLAGSVIDYLQQILAGSGSSITQQYIADAMCLIPSCAQPPEGSSYYYLKFIASFVPRLYKNARIIC